MTLRDLIIQPVQRIPRYELYIKDFLKSTNLNHPDYPLLLKAQSEIHSLAEQIDQVQREVGSTDTLPAAPHNSLEAVQEMIENLNDVRLSLDNDPPSHFFRSSWSNWIDSTFVMTW